jgi:hypothetical protein
MSDTENSYRDEIVIGLLGLLVSTGFLKANELFQFFDMLDMFHVQQTTLFVRAPEFLAAVGFAGFYVVFLMMAAFALAIVTRVRGRPVHRRSGLRIVSSVITILVVVQFMSLAASFSHAMHRYNEAIVSAQHVEWTLTIRQNVDKPKDL